MANHTAICVDGAEFARSMGTEQGRRQQQQQWQWSSEAVITHSRPSKPLSVTVYAFAVWPKTTPETPGALMQPAQSVIDGKPMCIV